MRPAYKFFFVCYIIMIIIWYFISINSFISFISGLLAMKLGFKYERELL